MLRVVAKATFHNLALKVIGIASSMLASILIARSFGADVLGHLSYVLAYSGFLGVFLSGAFAASLPRFWSVGDNTSNSNIVAIALLHAALFGVLVFVFFVIFNVNDGVLIACLSFFMAAISILQVSIRLYGRYFIFSILQNSPGVLWLFVVALIVTYSTSLKLFLYLISYAIPVFIAFILLAPLLKPSLRVSRPFSIIKASWMFAPSALSAIVFTQTDFIIMSWYLSNEEIGYYAVASKISVVCSFVLVASNNFLQGELVKFGRQWSFRHLKLFRKINRVRMLTSLFIILVVGLFRGEILSLFGAKFTNSEVCLIILLIGAVVSNIAGPVGMLCNTFGSKKGYNLAVVVFASLNAVLNACLVPIYGIEGGAFSTAVSIASLNVAAYVLARRSNLYAKKIA